MPDAVVQLTKPIHSHEGQLTEFVLREPTGREFLAIGEVYAWDKNAEGETIGAPIPSAIEAYVERCCKKPELLPQLSLADGIRVRDAVLGFFGVALAAAYGKAPSSSSGKPGSAPPASGSA